MLAELNVLVLPGWRCAAVSRAYNVQPLVNCARSLCALYTVCERAVAPRVPRLVTGLALPACCLRCARRGLRFLRLCVVVERVLVLASHVCSSPSRAMRSTRPPWGSSQQPLIALSSCKADIMAGSRGAKSSPSKASGNFSRSWAFHKNGANPSPAQHQHQSCHRPPLFRLGRASQAQEVEAHT